MNYFFGRYCGRKRKPHVNFPTPRSLGLTPKNHFHETYYGYSRKVLKEAYRKAGARVLRIGISGDGGLTVYFICPTISPREYDAVAPDPAFTNKLWELLGIERKSRASFA